MKTVIWVSYNYGVWRLVYKTEIELPFTPFIGLHLTFDEEKEYEVEFANHDYCTTTIWYSLEKKQFLVDVRNIWKRPVSDETIDSIIKRFSTWEKAHNEDIPELKELMAREAKRYER